MTLYRINEWLWLLDNNLDCHHHHHHRHYHYCPKMWEKNVFYFVPCEYMTFFPIGWWKIFGLLESNKMHLYITHHQNILFVYYISVNCFCVMIIMMMFLCLPRHHNIIHKCDDDNDDDDGAKKKLILIVIKWKMQWKKTRQISRCRYEKKW